MGSQICYLHYDFSKGSWDVPLDWVNVLFWLSYWRIVSISLNEFTSSVTRFKLILAIYERE